MGLLSDPEVGSGRWTRAVVGAQGAVCAVATAAALVWLCALVHPALHSPTYFSENALLPGLVRSDMPRDGRAARLYSELQAELQEKYAGHDGLPVPWLVAKMSQLKLEVYTHNYTLEYPLGRTQTYRGSSVYGVVRAARAAAQEALVVSVPYRPPSSPLPPTTAGLALVLAYAHLARGQRYWAKDLIFLVTEHEQLGVQAWLEAYHGGGVAPETWGGSLGGPVDRGGGDGGAWLHAGSLPARSGVIQAAINIEIDSPDIKYLEVKPEGLNGQLSNLDLVNLAHRMCDKADVPHAARRARSWEPPPSATARLAALLDQLAARAPGAPTGNHGLFHRYGIEAVTLQGGAAAALPSVGWHALGLALEGVMRSLNNLLERFHQSYFFYFLLTIDRFASIGQYMPSLCLPVTALLVRAVALCAAGPGVGGRGGALFANMLVLHAAGYLLMISPGYVTRLGARFGHSSEASLFWWAAAASAMLAGAARAGGRLGGGGGGALLAVPLLELATLLLAVGLHNAPLALLLAAVYTPVALLVPGERAGGWRRVAAGAACLLAHPLAALTLALTLAGRAEYPEDGAAAALARGVSAAQQALVFGVVDQAVYGNWCWSVVCAALVPVWCSLWQRV